MSMACRGTRVKGKQAIGLDEGIGQSRPRARDSPSSRPPLALDDWSRNLWGVKGSVKTRVQSPTMNEERPPIRFPSRRSRSWALHETTSGRALEGTLIAHFLVP